jgi:phosphatidylglycerophosphate synthase
MLNLSDNSISAFMLMLNAERIHLNEIKPVRKSWEIFLAKARKKFLIDELTIKNGLSTDNLKGSVLEIDDASSELTDELLNHGYTAEKVSRYRLVNPINIPNMPVYGITTSHNQIEHLSSFSDVNNLLNNAASLSRYGMIHQIHAIDDPAFDWDPSHLMRIKGDEWHEFFKKWAEIHAGEGWSYLGNHKGFPGRPRNFVLEKNGSFPFYQHYEEHTIRRIIAELTVANGISASRIPLLFLAFGIGQENPYLLSGLIGAIHALDAADGYMARKGFGNSPQGPMIDIYSDHLVEAITMYEFAYKMNLIPHVVPWILTARNMSTDILRFLNAIKTQKGTLENHPHEAFGTTGKKGRIERLAYGLIKAIGDMIIPVVPNSGICVSSIHITTSIARAMPVWTSERTKQIHNDVFKLIKSRIRH